MAERNLPERNLPEGNLAERNLPERNLAERNLADAGTMLMQAPGLESPCMARKDLLLK